MFERLTVSSNRIIHTVFSAVCSRNPDPLRAQAFWQDTFATNASWWALWAKWIHSNIFLGRSNITGYPQGTFHRTSRTYLLRIGIWPWAAQLPVLGWSSPTASYRSAAKADLRSFFPRKSGGNILFFLAFTTGIDWPIETRRKPCHFEWQWKRRVFELALAFLCETGLASSWNR